MIVQIFPFFSILWEDNFYIIYMLAKLGIDSDVFFAGSASVSETLHHLPGKIQQSNEYVLKSPFCRFYFAIFYSAGLRRRACFVYVCMNF